MVATSLFPKKAATHVDSRHPEKSWWVMYLCLIGASVGISLLLFRTGAVPQVIAWLVYLAGVAVIIKWPRYGVYLLVGLTLMSDSILVPWYPFVKNFSSRESILFLNDALIINPLETYIVLLGLSWLGRMILTRRVVFHQGPLFWPAVVFLVFVTYGLVYGLSRGGNVTIGLWESRSTYYLLAMLIFVGNLIETREDVNIFIWTTVIALFIKSIFGIVYIATELHYDVSTVEQIAEHSMSIQFNSFFALVIAVWLFYDTSSKKYILPLMLPTFLISFFANHRRAGFLTLGIVVVALILMLFKQNRRLFWWIAPTCVIVGILYTAIFWNASGVLGMPARSIKSVIGEPSARDYSSNLYREVENMNIMFTVKTAPLQGVGFGQKFYIAYRMDDISGSFEWWEYITHNSIMWIWMKLGVGGFLSMIFLIGSSLSLGGRAIWNVPSGPLRVAAMTATVYIFAHFVYAYVDMSWDTISMVYVGSMMGLLNGIERVAATTPAQIAPRWPWLGQNEVPAKRVLARWNG